MKPYKKYGDFYVISKQVRSNLKTNGFHGSRQGLMTFWHERAQECYREGSFDSMYAYLAMVALANVIDNKSLVKDSLFWWRMFVISFRLSYN